MISFPLKKNLILVGMMGSGKTTLGKKLAQYYNAPSHDSDQIIENETGLSIQDIFDLHGEKKFRTQEYTTITKLLTMKSCVISVGGGAFIQDALRHNIKQNAYSLWIDMPLNILWERVKQSKNRPLISQKKEAEKKFATLYKERYPLYAKADIHLHTKALSPTKTFLQIVDLVKNHAKQES